jgi:hypothetical protein
MIDYNSYFNIIASNISISSAIQEANLSSKRKDELKTVNILALPTKGYHGKDGAFFFGGARDFYMYCQENDPNHPVDFCIEKTEYKEIDLNSIELFLGTFLISSIILPVFVNLISNYLSSKLTHHDDKITINIIINNATQNNSTQINFRGTKDSFNEKVLKALNVYNKEGKFEIANEVGSNVDVLS